MTQKSPQLLFLPGASGNTSFWYPLIQYLKTSYSHKIIAYSGFGDAPVQPEIQSFETLTEYVLTQIEEPSILIAQSMGGIFAVAATLQKPDLIKGLVLIATSGGINLEPYHARNWRQDYQQQYEDYPDWFMRTNVNYETLLSEIQLNILLIWGDCDPISPVAVGKHLQNQFKDAHLNIIQGGDHMLAEAHADEVALLIQDYLLNNPHIGMEI